MVSNRHSPMLVLHCPNIPGTFHICISFLVSQYLIFLLHFFLWSLFSFWSSKTCMPFFPTCSSCPVLWNFSSQCGLLTRRFLFSVFHYYFLVGCKSYIGNWILSVKRVGTMLYIYFLCFSNGLSTIHYMLQMISWYCSPIISTNSNWLHSSTVDEELNKRAMDTTFMEFTF